MRKPESFFPASRFGAIRSVTSVTAGLSGAGVYAVVTEAGEFFLRLHAAESGGFTEMVRAQRLAAERGIAPEVVLVDAAAGAVVSAKAEGVQLGRALAQPDVRPLALKRVAEAFARLHSISVSDFPVIDPALAASIWHEQSQRDGFPVWAKSFGEFIACGNAALASDPRHVLGHNDANPANLLWDGSRVIMVDWERAALAHPYIDLATFSVFVNLADAAALELLAVQEASALSSEQGATFFAIRNMVRAIYGAVFLRLVPDLSQINFPARDDTPTLAECYARLGRGELDPTKPAGQALLGAALFRQIENAA
jgi:hypothetical protein